ncbi:serine hydrolase [Paenibacillus sp. Y412MC10]|uniref:serine hydrolase domain-containing protein n=1 Tax=Geobacillus sp. (strain Y412MC10) TaxID=481743 RepID=UPI0011A63051|nr:serine hydrolase domain-containing protein [Paenibacillus sp. Y412MC10]
MIIPDHEIIEEANYLVQEHYGERNPLSVTIGILENGDHFYTGWGQPPGFDYASAIYEIASVTKVFTTSLLCILQRQGKLQLKDTVGQYIPEIASNAKVGAITLEQLATHTSGLPRLPAGLKKTVTDKLNPYQNYTEQHLLQDLLKTRPSSSGSFEYSNLGVGLLGLILSRCTGRSLEQLMREEICGPLFMEDTLFELNEEQQSRLLPVYTANGKPVPHWDLGVLAGAGGLRSTAHDLLQFAKANVGMGSAPITAALRDGQKPRHRVRRGEDVSLGWMVKTGIYHDRIHWHNGGTYGSSSFLGFHMEKNTAVVVLSNNGSFAMKMLSMMRPQKRHVDEIGFQLFKQLTKTVY